MFAIISLLGIFIADLFKSRRRLEVENLFLRHHDRALFGLDDVALANSARFVPPFPNLS